jgi:hypothetical protein
MMVESAPGLRHGEMYTTLIQVGTPGTPRSIRYHEIAATLRSRALAANSAESSDSLGSNVLAGAASARDRNVAAISW